MKSIFDFWPIPEFTPRPNQVRALEWLEENHSQYKYLFLQAPVGSGKSLIGATFANYKLSHGGMDSEGNTLRGGFYLTPQIILQKQYETSFPEGMMASLYGKGNYHCSRVKSSCDVGSALKKKCRGCPYAIAKAQAVSSDHVILNYKLALLQFHYTQTWNDRHVIVHDECHGLEEYLTELSAPQITKNKCEKYSVKWKVPQSLDVALDWVSETYIPAASKYMSTLYAEVKEIIDNIDKEPTPREAKLVKELNALEEHLDELQLLLLSDRNTLRSSVVLVTDEQLFKFKPLSGAGIFHDVLNYVADNHLFMSSTILNHEGFCKDLGIDPAESSYLELDSDFPVEQRPIFYMPQCKMNASWSSPENENGRRKMHDKIREICQMHAEDSGIIHVGNFKIADWVVRTLQNLGTHNVWHHLPGSGDNRNDIIDAFQKDPKPAILVSPSITEGLDLKDDLARFAIFVKIPFGFLGDQWIKQRMNMSQEWYQRRTLIDVVQGSGRVVRGAEDWGNTYILDESWGFLFKKAGKFIPQWWKDGYRVMSS